jgi:hypothetical protein
MSQNGKGWYEGEYLFCQVIVFEPTIPASERPQTHALDSAATGIGVQNDKKTDH